LALVAAFSLLLLLLLRVLKLFRFWSFNDTLE